MPLFKILYLISGLPQDGTQTVLYQLLRHLDRRKFEIRVISLMDEGPVGAKIKELGIPVYAARMPAGKLTPASLIKLLKTLRLCGQPEILQGWDYHGNFAALFASIVTRWKASVVWGIHHTPYILDEERKLTALLIRCGAHFSSVVNNIIYVSVASKMRHESLGYCSKLSQVIPNGFDLSKFKPSASLRALVRSELGIGENSFLIGLFARFHPTKDHENFLIAAGILAKNHSNVNFLLAGKQVDHHNSTITQLVENNGLQGKTFLLGQRSDIPALLTSLDTLAVSSIGEAFPIIIGEAMACGVPCVVTDVGDSARIVGETGLVVPPRDPVALAAAWERLLNLDLEVRRKIGMAARQRVQENYSLEMMVQAYEHLYTEVSEAKGVDR